VTQTLDTPTLPQRRATTAPRAHVLPPAIIVGGGANALSVARSLGRMGVPVYVLNERNAFVRFSRHCRKLDAPIPRAGEEAQVWSQFLLGPESDALAGAVVLACSDAGIETIAGHREALAQKYILDDSHPPAQLAMLNKLATYQAAVEAGVPTPKFWLADSREELADVRDRLVFPLIVKPRLSHVFERSSGKKLIVANRFEEVASAVETITATGTGCMLVEMIPGPDDRLCSYFTYLDEDSQPLLHFTKRVIRRFPALTGSGCYHITDWNPQLVGISNRLFSHVKLRGVANVEYKLDVRDGQYKLIECNARFTASDNLVSRSGVDLGAFVYNRLTGRPQPPMGEYIRQLRQWDPIRDFQAYLGLRKTGQLTFAQWLKSVAHLQTFPYFNLSDPMPALARFTAPLRRKLGLSK
jgi:predicted ATP-grasp superfamily ATP-dependent carboligase